MGYDETKKMLNLMRKLNENTINSKKTIQEQIEQGSQTNPQQQQKNDIAVINDVDVKILSNDSADMEITNEQKNTISGIIDSFREQVSRLAEFEPGFTINQEQIRLDGSIPDQDVNFVLISGNEGGLYLNADMLNLTPETLIILDKLSKFEQPFKDAMEPILSYRKNN
jgi:hypothetical protein